jgi:uridine kinase
MNRPNSCGSDSGSGDEAQIANIVSPSPLLAPRSRMAPRNRTTSTSEKDGTIHVKGCKTIYTAGRPPWYDSSGQMKEALVIGLCGGSASGKTTVAKKIIEELNVQWVSLLSMDSFYKVLTKEEHESAERNEYNFDHPNSFDFDLILKTLQQLKKGKKVNIPIYNFTTHSREYYSKTVYGANVVIFEGIMAFATKEILDLMDLKIFVDTDADIRLSRRLKRDIGERGRGIESVLAQYNKYVKPAFDYYIAPTMTFADIIVPRGGDNKIAIDLIVKHVHRELSTRGCKFRSDLAQNNHKPGAPLPRSLNIIDQTSQIKYMHTVIRNTATKRDDFIFYTNRLMRLLIEYALSLLPFEDFTVKTTSGQEYEGKRHLTPSKVCGVSILRAGECLEPALCEVYKDACIGKILIQTNDLTGEPELHYLRLPSDIKSARVLLMDATCATGAAAIMGIWVLLDLAVEEENIFLVSILMSEQGVHNVAYAFPKVKIITTAVDPELNSFWNILPGMGNFGDRYFGTERAVYQ